MATQPTTQPIGLALLTEPRLNAMEKLVATSMRAIRSLWPGASSSALARQCSPLDLAVNSRDYAAARRLVILGAPLNPVRREGRVVESPVAKASSARGGKSSAELLLLFLDAGANPDMRVRLGMERGLLCPALLAGSWDCAEILLSRMKNPLAADEDGVSPVFAAALRISQDFGQTPEHLPLFAKICASLAALGADFNKPEERGNHSTPLIIASGHCAVVDILLSHGANPNIANAVGLTPLMGACHEAALWGDVSAAMSLVSAGADVHAVDDRGVDAFGYLSGIRASQSPLSAHHGAALTLCLFNAGWRASAEVLAGPLPPGFFEGMAQWEAERLSATASFSADAPRQSMRI